MAEPLVSILCNSYNHADFIRDAFEGILSQKTDFSYEVIVHDDCSTDGTQEIVNEYIRKYPGIFIPFFETENQYAKGNIDSLMAVSLPLAKGKYIAFCEADDYWNVPDKLQRQVDFLENNPEYGLVYTDFDIKNQTTGKVTHSVFNNKIPGFTPFYSSPGEFLMKEAYVCPPSWVYRKELVPPSGFHAVDDTMGHFAHFMATSKVKYMDFASATYRVHSQSETHTANFDKIYKRIHNLLEMKLKLIDYYNLDKSIIPILTEHHHRLHLVDMVINRKQDDIKQAKLHIRNKTLRDNLLFLADSLNLSPILKFIRKIKPSNY